MLLGAQRVCGAPSLRTDARVQQKRAPRKAESTDPIATFLTRRFGLAGGLAWLGVLTFGVLSEQIKTRMEVAREATNSKDLTDAVEVITASGLKYTDLRRGGGETAPQRGYLLAVDLRVEDAADGSLFFDSGNRPLAFFFRARPLQAPLCAGLEEGLASMRVGSVRRIVVPPQLGLPPGTRFPGGLTVADGQSLAYTVKLTRVSVPPS